MAEIKDSPIDDVTYSEHHRAMAAVEIAPNWPTVERHQSEEWRCIDPAIM